MYKLTSFLLFLLVAISTTIAQSPFVIELAPPKDISISSYALTWNNGEEQYNSSLEIKDGKATFKGKVNQPVKTRIALTLSADKQNKKAIKYLDVILEPAKIFIDASRGLEEVRYTGTKTQEEFTAYNDSLRPFLKSMRLKKSEMAKARSQGNKDEERWVLEEGNDLVIKARNVQQAFIEKNSRSVVTALMLEEYAGVAWENLENVQRYYNKLPANLKALPDLTRFGHRLSIASTMSLGKQFPDFALPDSSGNMTKVSSLLGKYVLVDFWGSFCAPCRAESPKLVAAYSRYKNKDFEILSISFDTETELWRKAVAKDRYTWTNLIDTVGFGSDGDGISAKLDISSLPRNFLLDKSGKVIATNLRGEALETKLHELLGG